MAQTCDWYDFRLPWVLPARMGRDVSAGKFTAALLLAPIIWAVIGAPLFLVPTAGAVLGAPFYLLLGAPALWMHLRRNPPTPVGCMKAAFMANLLTPVLWLIGVTLLWGWPDTDIIWNSAILFPLTLIHAPVWGLTFGWLYRRWAPESGLNGIEDVFE